MIRLFHSGTLLAIGAASRSHAHESLTDAIADLDEMVIPVPAAPDIAIENMIFTADLGDELHLPAVADGVDLDRTEYEPEQPPALIY